MSHRNIDKEFDPVTAHTLYYTGPELDAEEDAVGGPPSYGYADLPQQFAIASPTASHGGHLPERSGFPSDPAFMSYFAGSVEAQPGQQRGDGLEKICENTGGGEVTSDSGRKVARRSRKPRVSPGPLVEAQRKGASRRRRPAQNTESVVAAVDLGALVPPPPRQLPPRHFSTELEAQQHELSKERNRRAARDSRQRKRDARLAQESELATLRESGRALLGECKSLAAEIRTAKQLLIRNVACPTVSRKGVSVDETETFVIPGDITKLFE